MKNHLLLVLLIISITYPAMATNKGSVYSTEDVQGGWWSSCNDTAVEFFIDGAYYFGDFLGKYKVEVAGNKITFTKGLIDGHSVNVTGVPLVFVIVKLTQNSLQLTPVKGNPYEGMWVLHSCAESGA